MKRNTITGLAFGTGLAVFFIITGILKADRLSAIAIIKLIGTGIIAGTAGGFIFGWLISKSSEVRK